MNLLGLILFIGSADELIDFYDTRME